MIEFGRAVMVCQIITNASREGARLAVLDGSTAADVRNKVSTYLTNASVPMPSPSTQIVISPADPASATYGQDVSVRVDVPFSQVSWVPLPKIPFSTVDLKSLTLSATSVMRRETVQ